MKKTGPWASILVVAFPDFNLAPYICPVVNDNSPKHCDGDRVQYTI